MGQSCDRRIAQTGLICPCRKRSISVTDRCPETVAICFVVAPLSTSWRKAAFRRSDIRIFIFQQKNEIRWLMAATAARRMALVVITRLGCSVPLRRPLSVIGHNAGTVTRRPASSHLLQNFSVIVVPPLVPPLRNDQTVLRGRPRLERIGLLNK